MHERTVDCLGAFCPTPIIELSKAIREIESGQTILLKADDPATLGDLQAWARMTGNSVFSLSENEFEIRKN